MVHEVECLHSEKIDEIGKDLKTILTILNGNGKIGIVAKVNILWSCIMFVMVTVIGLVAHNFFG